MEVIWRNPAHQSPVLFSRKADFFGLRVEHRCVSPGDMPEQVLIEHELTVTLSGKFSGCRHTATGGKRGGQTSVGKFCLVPSGQSFQASWGENLEHLSMFVSPELLTQTALENHLAPRVELREVYQENGALIQQLGLALLAADAQEHAGRLYIDSLKQTLLLYLLENYGVNPVSIAAMRGGLSGYKWRRVGEFIRENLENDLSLAELASVAELSPFHFIRVFRQRAGMTPQQYLMRQRVERAKQLLAESDLPLVEIGFRTGFKNQSHFTTLFRKFTAVTPKIWRESKAS